MILRVGGSAARCAAKRSLSGITGSRLTK